MNESKEILTLRAMAWARAKGELEAYLNTFWPDYNDNGGNDSSFAVFDGIIGEFIKDMEDEIWCPLTAPVGWLIAAPNGSSALWRMRGTMLVSSAHFVRWLAMCGFSIETADGDGGVNDASLAQSITVASEIITGNGMSPPSPQYMESSHDTRDDRSTTVGPKISQPVEP